MPPSIVVDYDCGIFVGVVGNYAKYCLLITIIVQLFQSVGQRYTAAMIEMASDSEKRKAARCRKNSPTSEEISSGGSPLKKGPWTSAEDAILLDYVTKHGEGNWNAVQKHSGLSRCGKSCRLRWANHLRPDLKKGAFTADEENRIIDLHAKMGNKWARMAAELPGRTDNEIKNFWNTRIKRLQRAGLPIYPENRTQTMNESQQSDDMMSCENGDLHYSDPTETNGIEIPAVQFKNLMLNRDYLNCSVPLLDIHHTSFLQSGASPSNGYGFMFSATNPHKRLREVESQFCGSVESTSNAFPSFEHYDEDDLFGRLDPGHPLWSSSSYDPELNVNQTSPIDVLGSHAHINGNSSSSDPISEAMKLELPSLQYSTSQVGSWAAPSSSLPSHESVDTLIQSPLSEHTQSTYPSPRCSGLLDSVVYECKSLKCSNHNSHHQFQDTSVIADDGVKSSSMSLCETKWDTYGDPISPLSHSAASVFVDHTPVSGGSSSDEPQSAETMPGKFDWLSGESDGKKDSYQLQYLRPDVALDSFWCSSRIRYNKDHLITGDFGSLLGEDPGFEYKLSDESNQSFVLGSSAWDHTSADYPVSKQNY